MTVFPQTQIHVCAEDQFDAGVHVPHGEHETVKAAPESVKDPKRKILEHRLHTHDLPVSGKQLIARQQTEANELILYLVRYSQPAGYACERKNRGRDKNRSKHEIRSAQLPVPDPD